MKAWCKKSYWGFQKGKYYEIKYISSIFEANDFITLKSDLSLSSKSRFDLFRFRLNKSQEYNEMIGEAEVYFYDYFYSIQEERKMKLNQISKNIS